VFFKPTAPPYDPLDWDQKPFTEKARMVCSAWALQGYGTPLAIYLFYALKMLLHAGAWLYFCGFTEGMGSLDDFGSWALTPIAFQKAILWNALFEILGLGCGSGPLTGRFVPPIGGFLYFLRPGTTKLPVFEGAPIIGGMKRGVLDVALYAVLIAILFAELVSPAPSQPMLLAIAVLLPVLGVLDKTVFLCARGEHYWTMIVVLAATSDFIPGTKAIHAALWFWAGVSKLNHHFPAVVGVMTSNSPFTRFEWIRKLMYRRYPDDLNPSGFATIMGHAGTLLELSVPMVLLAGDGGTVTIVGLVMMLMLHGFITSNVPMGVPLEWNVMMVYGGFYLFYENADVSVLSMSAPIATFVIVCSIIVPLLGNLFPARVPFLLAMRYYAGNWAYSVWLFKKDAVPKLGKLVKSTPWVYDQLERFYDHGTRTGIAGRAIAFRLMHLHGRALTALVPKAVDNFQDYAWADGEVIAGMALGWNFGDGHLHDEQLLRAIQAQCGFEPGEVRCIMVESQPIHIQAMHYRIVDAKTGLLEEGHAQISELRARQPWG
jgi:hypothetical protein